MSDVSVSRSEASEVSDTLEFSKTESTDSSDVFHNYQNISVRQVSTVSLDRRPVIQQAGNTSGMG